jgi:predicted flap endonuclease-1-like 5' DNA nuclease
MFRKESPYRVMLGGIFLAAFLVLLQLWIRKPKKNQVIFTYKLKPPTTPIPVEKPTPAIAKQKTPKKSIKDDLTKVSGIGPKTASHLQSLGITTFKQIAAMKESELIKILNDANLRATNVDAWIKQCKQLI